MHSKGKKLDILVKGYFSL